MNGRARLSTGARLAVLVLGTGLALLLPAAPAWAPHVPQLLIEPAQAAPGETVTITGTRGYGFTNPVEIHFDAPDGPLLGSFQPGDEGYAPFGPGSITIPADAAPGAHTIFATQNLEDFEDHIRGLPARGLVEVVGASSPLVSAPVSAADTIDGSPLVSESTGGILPLVLTGLGVAGLALLGGGALALAKARPSDPEAQAIRSR